MRILHVCHRFPPSRGGVESHVSNVAERMATMGHEVDVFTTTSLAGHLDAVGLNYEPLSFSFTHDDHGLPQCVREHGYRVFRFRPFIQAFSWHLAPGLLAHLLRKGGGYDVIHCHSLRFSSVIYTALAGSVHSKTAIVMTPHEGVILDYRGTLAERIDSFYRMVFYPFLFNQVDCVIALSDQEELLYREAGVPPAKIRVIPNGVNLDEFENPPDGEWLRRQLGNPANVILYVGRFISFKQPDLIIQALPDILREVPNTHLLMVGKDCGLLPYCKQLAARLGVTSSVTFLENAGTYTLMSAYSIADFCVSPSLFEPFPLTLLEAFASSKPVVATATGAYRSLVKHGATGLVLDKATRNTVGDACLTLLRGESLRKQMGETAKHVAEAFSWDNVADALLKVYQDVTKATGDTT